MRFCFAMLGYAGGAELIRRGGFMWEIVRGAWTGMLEVAIPLSTAGAVLEVKVESPEGKDGVGGSSSFFTGSCLRDGAIGFVCLTMASSGCSASACFCSFVAS